MFGSKVRLRTYFGFLLIGSFCILFAASNAMALKVRLRSQIIPQCTSSAGANLKFADIFGDGNIAVQGSYGCRGAFIYDITDPDQPVLASWYNPGNNIQFLEAIVIGNRGYFGSGNSNGVHIVDLTDPYHPVLLGIANASNGNGFSSIHEMVVFNQGGADYLIENFNGFSTNKLRIINVSNPASCVFVREFTPTESVWVHAMHVRGDRLFTSGWGSSSVRGRTEIYDISNVGVQAPTLLGFIADQSSITAGNNMHSAWSSEDGNYLYSCREVTNSNGPTPGDLRVYDIHDPAQPVLVNSIGMAVLGLNAVTPHNPVVMGHYLYIAWYQAGLQVFDLTDPVNPVRVGEYDTFPQTFTQPEKEKQALIGAEPWDLICGSEFVQNELPTTYDGAWAVYPFLGQNKVLAGDLQNGLFILDASEVAAPPRNQVSDFDGDLKTDVSVFTPVSGDWRMEASSTGAVTETHFGIQEDVIVPGDYDGDGKTDFAVFRPSLSIWYILGSTGGFMDAQFGAAGDVPVAADYDADGRTDVAVFRPSTGIWYIQQSTLGFKAVQWGTNGDKALTGDYDGDGKTDLTVWRPSTGIWYVLQSSSSIPIYRAFGQFGDKPLYADFDGNGISDIAVFRPSTGIWYIIDPATEVFSAYYFGIAEDIPVPADYDGDGKTDLAVFRPSTDYWYRLNSSTGEYIAKQFGKPGDDPSPSSVQP